MEGYGQDCFKYPPDPELFFLFDNDSNTDESSQDLFQTDAGTPHLLSESLDPPRGTGHRHAKTKREALQGREGCSLDFFNGNFSSNVQLNRSTQTSSASLDTNVGAPLSPALMEQTPYAFHNLPEKALYYQDADKIEASNMENPRNCDLLLQGGSSHHTINTTNAMHPPCKDSQLQHADFKSWKEDTSVRILSQIGQVGGLVAQQDLPNQTFQVDQNTPQFETTSTPCRLQPSSTALPLVPANDLEKSVIQTCSNTLPLDSRAQPPSSIKKANTSSLTPFKKQRKLTRCSQCGRRKTPGGHGCTGSNQTQKEKKKLQKRRLKHSRQHDYMRTPSHPANTSTNNNLSQTPMRSAPTTPISQLSLTSQPSTPVHSSSPYTSSAPTTPFKQLVCISPLSYVQVELNEFIPASTKTPLRFPFGSHHPRNDSMNFRVYEPKAKHFK
eukprot:m.13271 g.13271  ORF g.13271 m.13271 type:complete len:441 (-) comp7487_c0_seq1:176-1498(-)